MNSVGRDTAPAGVFAFLDRSHTIAEPGFNRWLVPPAALAIHLCIGMAYGFSVFRLPLSRAIGITAPVACPTDMSLIGELFTASCDWKISSLGWMYTLFFVFLGSSAAVWGGWLEKAGPRKAGVVAALCWGGGFFVSAVGVQTHQLWLMWLGSGVLGGIGLGLGYISPVSTLIKWFPDRRGMATGMAIMGFGGGAMIGAPPRRHADEDLRHRDLGRRVANLRGARRDLFRVLPARPRALWLGAVDGERRPDGAVRRRLLHHPVDVRR